MRRNIKAILKAAQLERLKIQELRHPCASLLLARGVDPKIVQETLGHSQTCLTPDTNSHLIPGLQQETARTIDTLLTEESEESREEESVGVNRPDGHPEAITIRRIS